MSIDKVWVEEGFTLCYLCESICPEVFFLDDTSSHVKDGADFGQYEEKIKEAANSCPVEVIKFE